MCQGGIGAGLRKRFLNIRENREDPVHIQRPISPFTVGVKLYLGSSGAADKQGFTALQLLNILGGFLFAPHSHHKSTGSGSDGRRHRGAGHGCETSSGRRAEHIDPGAAISGFMRPVRVNPLLELTNRLLLYALKVEVVRDTSAAEGAVMVVLGSGLRKVTSGAINRRPEARYGSSPHCCCWNTH